MKRRPWLMIERREPAKLVRSQESDPCLWEDSEDTQVRELQRALRELHVAIQDEEPPS